MNATDDPDDKPRSLLRDLIREVNYSPAAVAVEVTGRLNCLQAHALGRLASDDCDALSLLRRWLGNGTLSASEVGTCFALLWRRRDLVTQALFATYIISGPPSNPYGGTADITLLYSWLYGPAPAIGPILDHLYQAGLPRYRKVKLSHDSKGEPIDA